MSDVDKNFIGYCGYNCYLCPARSEDIEVRQRMVDVWKKYLGHESYTAENVKCAGCPSDGEVADKQCKARPCAKEKGVSSCALCGEFPCGKMSHLMSSHYDFFIRAIKRFGEISEEDYKLCLAQWNSIPNLYKIMINAGKLPEWLLKYDKK